MTTKKSRIPLKFSVRDIRDHEGLTHEGPVPAAEFLEGEPGLFGEVRPTEDTTVSLEFSVGGAQILLQGSVRGGWRVPCARCLSPVDVAFEGELEETYPIHLETVDVTEEVRQALVLSLPQKTLCGDDCKGNCARCGKNLNQGPCGCPEKRS